MRPRHAALTRQPKSSPIHPQFSVYLVLKISPERQQAGAKDFNPIYFVIIDSESTIRFIYIREIIPYLLFLSILRIAISVSRRLISSLLS